MAIKYEVVINNLKKGRYYPRVILGNRISLTRIIEDIVNETTLTETDVRAVINALVRRVIAYLRAGDVPDLEGLVSFSVSLSEDLPSADASVSDAVELNINAHAASSLCSKVRSDVSLERTFTRTRTPTLTALINISTKTENVYTVHKAGRLRGDDMKFNAEAADEGIFFVAVANNTVTQVTDYIDIGGREITFLIPAGLTGAYYLEVHTRYDTATLRIGRLQTPVTAAT